MSCFKLETTDGEDEEKIKPSVGVTTTKKNDAATLTTTLDVDDDPDDESSDAHARLSKKAKYLDPEACMYCEFSPCLWVQYSEGLVFDGNFFSASHTYEGDRTYNNLIRKHVYRKFSSMHLGIGNPRTPIPECVLKEIRLLYPEPDNNYMGFKANYAKNENGPE